MSALHPAAPHDLPAFIAGPGESDVLMMVMAAFLLGAVMGTGILFLRLHTLPERIAHKGKKIQFEIVAVLGLLALFTHMHIFWVAGLLLALIDIPDFGAAFGRMAGALEKMAGLPPGRGAEGVPDAPYRSVRADEAPPRALEPLHEGAFADVTPGSSCVANAYSSNHEKIASGELGFWHGLALHAVDAVGVVHAAILRLQALILPIRTLVFSGH